MAASANQMPLLSDDIVILRPWSRDDAGFIADANADAAIRRYSAPHDGRGHPSPPLSIRDAEATIDEFVANWRTFATTGTPSGVAFAIADARSGEVAGMCGIDQWSTEDVAQVGYWLAPSARGRGYATRAMVLLTRWLFELGAARVFLTIVAGNEASVEVARRAGFVYEGTMRSHGVWQGQRCDVMWFAALPLEWAHDGRTNMRDACSIRRSEPVLYVPLHRLDVAPSASIASLSMQHDVSRVRGTNIDVK